MRAACMPTRRASPVPPRRRIIRNVLFVTERLAGRRVRLKTDAVAGSERARAELRALDRALSPHVRRGARELCRLSTLAPPSATDSLDLNAAIAAETQAHSPLPPQRRAARGRSRLRPRA